METRGRVSQQMMNIQDWLPTLYTAAGSSLIFRMILQLSIYFEHQGAVIPKDFSNTNTTQTKNYDKFNLHAINFSINFTRPNESPKHIYRINTLNSILKIQNKRLKFLYSRWKKWRYREY